MKSFVVSIAIILIFCIPAASGIISRSSASDADEPGHGLVLLPGITLLTKLADPYATVLKDSVVISGTADYFLKLGSVDDIGRGGPFKRVHIMGDRSLAQSWDLKPVPWSQRGPRLWSAARDELAPRIIWYGGHVRDGNNASRDVFPFVQGPTGTWSSLVDSIFRTDWPRPFGNYLGHRYGHQIVMMGDVPTVFYEQVTDLCSNGLPAVTRIFANKMLSPFQAGEAPVELISPINPTTGKPYPSTVREDGSSLIEGPLYFRFTFRGERWEAIGFSAGSYYAANYTASFASRRVAEGLKGMPFRVDLNDDGQDIHDAGKELREALHLTGGPGRPAVIVSPEGDAILNSHGDLQILLHAYRRDVDASARVTLHAMLKVRAGPNETLRFDIPT